MPRYLMISSGFLGMIVWFLYISGVIGCDFEDLGLICNKSDLDELIVRLLSSYNTDVSLSIFCIVSWFSQCHTVSSIYASGGILIVAGVVFEISSRGDWVEIFRR